jgi:hypothetical protein
VPAPPQPRRGAKMAKLQTSEARTTRYGGLDMWATK